VQHGGIDVLLRQQPGRRLHRVIRQERPDAQEYRDRDQQNALVAR
jgi:hypothetical protein